MCTVDTISLIECSLCRWIFQFSVRICWISSWQTSRAGMHVINNRQKTAIKNSFSILFCLTQPHKDTQVHTPSSVTRDCLFFSLRLCPFPALLCSLICQSVFKEKSLLYLTRLFNSFPVKILK